MTTPNLRHAITRQGFPSTWEVVPFKNLLVGKIRHGLYKPSKYFGTGTKIVKMGLQYSSTRIGSQEMERVEVSENERKRFGVNEYDLLFSRTSMMNEGAGKCTIAINVKEPILFESNLLCATLDKEQAYPPFYLYFFNTLQGKHLISTIVHGTQSRSISSSNLMSLNVPRPPYEEQQRICQIPWQLDSLLNSNHEIITSLENVLHSIYARWFVNFEFPNEEGKPYKSSGGEMIDSEIGWIPRGWSVMSLSDAFEINPLRSLTKGTMAPYVEMADMPESKARITRHPLRAFSSGMRFKNGDTLVARITPCLENGKTAFVDFLQEEQVGWGSTEYIVVRPKPPVPVEFGYFLARSDRFRSFSISNMTGTSGRQRVPANCYQNFKIATPSSNVAEKFGIIASMVFEFMKSKDIESRILAEMRDILLPRLLSGQLMLRGQTPLLGDTKE